MEVKLERNGSIFGKVCWGLIFVLSAVVLILNGVGVEFGYGITPWRIILGIFLLAWLITDCVKLKFTDVFFPLAFLFIVFQGPLAQAMQLEKETILSPWIVLVSALLLTIGFKILFRKSRVVNVNGDKVKSKGIKGKIGNETIYGDASDLSNVVICDHLGTLDYYISNRESYDGNGKITVCDNLGKVTLHIPDEWNVISNSSDNLGQISIPKHEATGDKSIMIVITDNLGQVCVVFE